MRVGIDGGSWGNRRGYGRFLRQVLYALCRQDRWNEYTIFLDEGSCANFELAGRFRPVAVKTSRPLVEALSANSRRSAGDIFRMGRAAAREKLDLFFFPTAYSYFPLLRRIPTVLGIHDTMAYENPHLAFHSRLHGLTWRMKVRLAVARADTVLTVSNHSKRSIQRLLGAPEEKVQVVYEAAAAIFRKKDVPRPSEPFILYVGGISPNKNLSTLIRAFSELKLRQTGSKLMITGDHQTDRFKGCYPELRELVDALGLHEDVTFTGHVPDEALCDLYNQATLFVLPSHDEGFGLPALEAMACGTPVVVSSGNALEEVVAGAGIVVPAEDSSALAAAMERILADPALASDLRERGFHRASEFSWDRTAVDLLRIFEETLNRCSA